MSATRHTRLLWVSLLPYYSLPSPLSIVRSSSDIDDDPQAFGKGDVVLSVPLDVCIIRQLDAQEAMAGRSAPCCLAYTRDLLLSQLLPACANTPARSLPGMFTSLDVCICGSSTLRKECEMCKMFVYASACICIRARICLRNQLHVQDHARLPLCVCVCVSFCVVSRYVHRLPASQRDMPSLINIQRCYGPARR